MDVTVLDVVIVVMIAVVILQHLHIVRLNREVNGLKFRRDELRIRFFTRSKRS